MDSTTTETEAPPLPSKWDAIYHAKGFVRDDILEVKPNGLLLSGIMPPTTSLAGLALPNMSSVAGAMALMFRVEAMGPIDRERFKAGDTALDVHVGDVVIPRHCNLDPVGTGNRPLFFLHVADVFCILERAQ